ncbi:hypothetical protein RUND412_010755 [Rhizina undulata]
MDPPPRNRLTKRNPKAKNPLPAQPRGGAPQPGVFPNRHSMPPQSLPTTPLRYRYPNASVPNLSYPQPPVNYGVNVRHPNLNFRGQNPQSPLAGLRQNFSLMDLGNSGGGKWGAGTRASGLQTGYGPGNDGYPGPMQQLTIPDQGLTQQQVGVNRDLEAPPRDTSQDTPEMDRYGPPTGGCSEGRENMQDDEWRPGSIDSTVVDDEYVLIRQLIEEEWDQENWLEEQQRRLQAYENPDEDEEERERNLRTEKQDSPEYIPFEPLLPQDYQPSLPQPRPHSVQYTPQPRDPPPPPLDYRPSLPQTRPHSVQYPEQPRDPPQDYQPNLLQTLPQSVQFPQQPPSPQDYWPTLPQPRPRSLQFPQPPRDPPPPPPQNYHPTLPYTRPHSVQYPQNPRDPPPARAKSERLHRPHSQYIATTPSSDWERMPIFSHADAANPETPPAVPPKIPVDAGPDFDLRFRSYNYDASNNIAELETSSSRRESKAATETPSREMPHILIPVDVQSSLVSKTSDKLASPIEIPPEKQHSPTENSPYTASPVETPLDLPERPLTAHYATTEEDFTQVGPWFPPTSPPPPPPPTSNNDFPATTTELPPVDMPELPGGYDRFQEYYTPDPFFHYGHGASQEDDTSEIPGSYAYDYEPTHPGGRRGSSDRRSGGVCDEEYGGFGPWGEGGGQKVVLPEVGRNPKMLSDWRQSQLNPAFQQYLPYPVDGPKRKPVPVPEPEPDATDPYRRRKLDLGPDFYGY